MCGVFVPASPDLSHWTGLDRTAPPCYLPLAATTQTHASFGATRRFFALVSPPHPQPLTHSPSPPHLACCPPHLSSLLVVSPSPHLNPSPHSAPALGLSSATSPPSPPSLPLRRARRCSGLPSCGSDPLFPPRHTPKCHPNHCHLHSAACSRVGKPAWRPPLERRARDDNAPDRKSVV